MKKTIQTYPGCEKCGDKVCKCTVKKKSKKTGRSTVTREKLTKSVPPEDLTPTERISRIDNSRDRPSEDRLEDESYRKSEPSDEDEGFF